MSEKDVRKMIQEATKEAMKQSFTEAGQKYVAAAQAYDEEGKFAEADELRRQAAENFMKAADKYRSSKSFKIAALNMCYAGDVYSELASSDEALSTYEKAAEDLYSASTEHLMWGEDAETKKGTALAMAASMLYLMIGEQEKAFQSSRRFAAEHGSKLRFPGVVRLSQIPQMIEAAINSVDLDAFSEAERAAVTELKAALASANASEFVPYVDKGIEMVREILRGKLKVPKISAHLDLPIDMTFTEEFPLQANITNNGDGDALDLSIEWYLDDGLDIVSGKEMMKLGTLKAGDGISLELHVRATDELIGVKEYSIILRGSYKDELNTEYSLQAGPGTLVLKDFKETEKLLHDIDLTEGRLGILSTSLEESPFEQKPLSRLIMQTSRSLAGAREDVMEKELPIAKAKIAVVNTLVDTIDQIIADEELSRNIIERREEEKKEYVKASIQRVREKIDSIFESQEKAVLSKSDMALDDWDRAEEKRRELADLIRDSADKASKAKQELVSIYEEIPTAATTDDPELAKKRTGIRTSLEKARSEIEVLRNELEGLTKHAGISRRERPSIPSSIQRALEALHEAKDEIDAVFK
jgi:tetratricopeptide (TPR) repeat protein